MKSINRNIWKFITYGILIFGAILILLPFIWMIITAVKPLNEVMSIPIKWLPSQIKWENFTEVLQTVPFRRYFINSIIIAICITIGDLLISSLAAYSLAYFDFKGRKAFFLIMISTMMIPSEILMIPNYLLISNFGWLDTYKGLIIPWCVSGFSIFLLKQQFEQISGSYYKAAKLDGCSDLKFLFQILYALSKPTLLSVAIMKFIASWNSYTWPLFITNSDQMRTLPLALSAFSTEVGTKYNLQMAFTTMMILPILIVYLVMQKYIIKGISDAGMKG